MTEAAAKRRYSIEDYLRLERDSRDKYEYDDGEILAMSGGSPTHSLIASNVNGELRARLKGKRCRVYESNLRISVPGKRRYVYADGTVICGLLEYDPADTKQETVVNPEVIIEVLSPSTEKYDRTKKFDLYRSAASFREYVLVSQDVPRVETFLRQPDGTWAFDVAAGLQTSVRLRSLNTEVPLAEVYAGVEFPAEPARDPTPPGEPAES
jgi:Uma2 family endonuclease